MVNPSPFPKEKPTGARKSSPRPKRHPCPHCNRLFAGPHNVNQHVREKHTGDRPFICGICSRAFTRPWTMNRHLQHVHLVEPGFETHGQAGIGRRDGSPQVSEARADEADPRNDFDGLQAGPESYGMALNAGVEMDVDHPSQGVSDASSMAVVESGCDLGVLGDSFDAAVEEFTGHPRELNIEEEDVFDGETGGFLCNYCELHFLEEDEVLRHIHFMHSVDLSPLCSCTLCSEFRRSRENDPAGGQQQDRGFSQEYMPDEGLFLGLGVVDEVPDAGHILIGPGAGAGAGAGGVMGQEPMAYPDPSPSAAYDYDRTFMPGFLHLDPALLAYDGGVELAQQLPLPENEGEVGTRRTS